MHHRFRVEPLRSSDTAISTKPGGLARVHEEVHDDSLKLDAIACDRRQSRHGDALHDDPPAHELLMQQAGHLVDTRVNTT